MALGRQLLGAEIALDQALQHGVEHWIGRQRILVLLVGPELGRGRLGDDAFGDHLAPRAQRALRQMRVAPAAELEHRGLVDVFQDVVAAGHVAVERGVAHGHLGLVARRHHHGAQLVRNRHQGNAAGAALNILFRDIFFTVAEQWQQHLAERLHRRLDADDVVPDADRLGAGLGVLQ